MKTLICVLLAVAVVGCTVNTPETDYGLLDKIPTTVEQSRVLTLQIEDRDPVSDQQWPPQKEESSLWEAVGNAVAAPFEGIANLLGLKAVVEGGEEIARQAVNYLNNTRQTRIVISAERSAERVTIKDVACGRFTAAEIVVERPGITELETEPAEAPATQPAE